MTLSRDQWGTRVHPLYLNNSMPLKLLKTRKSAPWNSDASGKIKTTSNKSCTSHQINSLSTEPYNIENQVSIIQTKNSSQQIRQRIRIIELYMNLNYYSWIFFLCAIKKLFKTCFCLVCHDMSPTSIKSSAVVSNVQ